MKIKPTSEELEAVKAASKTNHLAMLPLIQERRELAVTWLDDGQWLLASTWVWRRTSPTGEPFIYDVDRDKLHIGSKDSVGGKVVKLSKAFEELCCWFYEIEGGIGPNRLLERRRTPRRNKVETGRKRTLAITPLNDSLLPPQAKQWNKNIPPPYELLVQLVRWDDNFKSLYYYNEDRDMIEYVTDNNFVEINGEIYAIWRVRSMLEFGNPNGIASLPTSREKLDEFVPIELPPPSMPAPLKRGSTMSDRELAEKAQKEVMKYHE